MINNSRALPVTLQGYVLVKYFEGVIGNTLFSFQYKKGQTLAHFQFKPLLPNEPRGKERERERRSLSRKEEKGEEEVRNFGVD